MFKPIFACAATLATLIAAPAIAGEHDRYAGLFDDSNSHYLDYKTDISEAKRELRNDMNSADSDVDRAEVLAEFDREIADAETDFIKEMAEDGVVMPRGRVTVESEVAAIVSVPRY